MMRIKEFKIYNLKIPFRINFKHNLKERSASDSLYLKITLENSIVGFGECLPIKYVTGDTIEKVKKELTQELNKLKKKYFKDFNQVLNYIKKNRLGCSKCALELAMFDAFGKYFEKDLNNILPGKKKPIPITGIIPITSRLNLLSFIWKLKKVNNIKVKVGDKEDLERVKKIRKIFPNLPIRLDANAAWTNKQAVKEINKFKPYKIIAVEQPTKTLTNLKTGIPIIADESLCTINDAKKLIKNRSTDIFNIRISKNGGILNSLELIRLAEQNNLRYIIGCQVGETSLISHVGKILAEKTHPMFYEGTYENLLLKINPAKIKEKYGLGIEVDEKVLDKYSQ